MKLVYFAWVRERVGKAEEEIVPPAGVKTVADLMRWLGERGEEYAHAFEHPKSIRAAIDKTHAFLLRWFKVFPSGSTWRLAARHRARACS